jgi:hypothetical protein
VSVGWGDACAVFERLASEPYNLAVVSYDAFSFGKSTTFADRRGHVDKFDYFVRVPLPTQRGSCRP